MYSGCTVYCAVYAVRRTVVQQKSTVSTLANPSPIAQQVIICKDKHDSNL
jgi:hypothetical protein